MVAAFPSVAPVDHPFVANIKPHRETCGKRFYVRAAG